MLRRLAISLLLTPALCGARTLPACPWGWRSPVRLPVPARLRNVFLELTRAYH